jgi:subtilisin family serine protease
MLALVALTISACRTATPETTAPAGTAAEPSGTPGVNATADVSANATPASKTMCQSSEDLAAEIAFLRSIDVSEDGVVSLIAGVDAALGEAQVLADLVVDEYRPLVEDTIVALQELRGIGEEARGQATLGAGIVTIGEAVTEVGQAMDALETELRQPCPQQIS